MFHSSALLGFEFYQTQSMPLPPHETSLLIALAAFKEEVLLPKLRQDVRSSAFSVSCVTDRSV